VVEQEHKPVSVRGTVKAGLWKRETSTIAVRFVLVSREWSLGVFPPGLVVVDDQRANSNAHPMLVNPSDAADIHARILGQRLPKLVFDVIRHDSCVEVVKLRERLIKLHELYRWKNATRIVRATRLASPVGRAALDIIDTNCAIAIGDPDEVNETSLG